MLLTALSLTLSGLAQAETKPTLTAPEAANTKDGVRRDPKGKQGLSPFWEAVRRGDAAALARDYVKAKQAYQEAITFEPKRAIAHYRIGQVEVLAGKLSDAETAYNDALRFVDSEPTLHAHLLFVLADLKERQEQRDAALKAWQAYADYLKSESRAKGYPATAEERQKRILRYNELVVECKGVKERVELRIKELDENAKRKAK
jgi:tetratricopeptide (TPR) repeat protein